MSRRAKILLVAVVAALMVTPATAMLLPRYVEPSKVRVFVKVGEGFDETLPAKLGGRIVVKYTLIPYIVVEIPWKALDTLSKARGVLSVELDGTVHAYRGPPTRTTQPAQTVPWGIERIGAPTAWSLATGSADVNGDGDSEIEVAIIDTGVDADHPDLSGNIKWGVSVLNGLIRTNARLWDDRNGHGTHVAGTVAALDNSIGVVGAAPSVELYIIKALSDTGSGTWSDLVLAIEVALKGPDQVLDSDGDGVIVGDPEDDAPEVISMSLGGSAPPTALHDIIVVAYNYGVVIVAAAGNEGAATPSYPAAYPEVIAVGATDSADAVPSWSNRNPEVAAPGVDILSTYPDDTYATLSGTSMATPHVSGTVALIQAARLANGLPLLPPGTETDTGTSTIRGILHTTADDAGAAGYDELYGYGIVRADLAVEAALSAP